MTNDILDVDARTNPDDWDSKTRIQVSDAIIEVNDQLKKVKFGRYLLFGLAAINLLVPLLSLLTSDSVSSDEARLSALVIGVLLLPFIAFGVFYPRSPRLFLTLVLIVYLIYLTVGSMMTGQGIASGFAWKIGVFTAFGVSLFGVSVWKRNLEKLKTLGYSPTVVMEARRALKPIPRLKRRKKTAG